MLGKYVVAYIDDILVHSPSLSMHVSHVCQVLQRLMRRNLYVKAEKCLFYQTSISFLGYLMIKNGGGPGECSKTIANSKNN